MKKLLFIDLETTGVDHNIHGIYQVSAIYATITKGVLTEVDKFSSFISPFNNDVLDEQAIAMAGVAPEELYKYPHPIQVHKQFTDWLCKYVDKYDRNDKIFLVNYWGHFDLDFLRAFFSHCGDKYYGSFFHSGGIDVCSLVQYAIATDMTEQSVPNFKLSTIAHYLSINYDTEKLHNADEDVSILFEVYKSIHQINE